MSSVRCADRPFSVHTPISGDRIAIATYLGSGDTFNHTIAGFADSYADQNQSDFTEVIAAVKSGVLEAHEDPQG